MIAAICANWQSVNSLIFFFVLFWIEKKAYAGRSSSKIAKKAAKIDKIVRLCHVIINIYCTFRFENCYSLERKGDQFEGR